MAASHHFPSPPPTRHSQFQRLTGHTFDVVIVGGGATGAATARDAALRGLKTLLVDCGDFASQTSSASSRLIHGGIRYLQYGNFGLVFEGLAERRRLMRTAPHLCQPIDFVFPAYKGGKPSLAAIGIGVRLYNLLALWQRPSKRVRLSAEQLSQQAPLLRKRDLLGAQIYQDCQTDDARLVLENVLDAEAAGAVCLNYVKADQPTRVDNIFTLSLHDQERDSDAIEVKTRAYVNATGPFSDTFANTHRLRPTLGVHIVVDAKRLPTNGRVFVLNSPRDGRLFFILPAGARTAIGTTDTDWHPEHRPRGTAEPGDAIAASRSDVDYLLEAANAAFPEARLRDEDVISTWAGLRPLVASLDASPSATSREHELFFEDGAVTIVGGKLTTMRKMAEQIVDRLCHWGRRRGLSAIPGKCSTATYPLPGAAAWPVTTDAEGALSALSEATQVHLRSRYGARAPFVAALCLTDASLAAPIDQDLPDVWAEVVFAARYEQARTVEDVLRRRLSVFRNGAQQGVPACDRVAASLAKELNASAAQQAAWVEQYKAAVAVTRRWASGAAHAASPESAL